MFNELNSFTRNGVVLYALGHDLFTKEEIETLDKDRQKRDEERGFEDRKNHVYDKWFRYNRRDYGQAYDLGVGRYVNLPHSEKWLEDDENFRVIACNP